MSETVDIVSLIDKNPIIRLTTSHNSKLIERIKETFTPEQQQLFVANFYCYLNFDTEKDFVINIMYIYFFNLPPTRILHFFNSFVNFFFLFVNFYLMFKIF